MKHIDEAGFAPPATRALGEERRSLAFAELIATIGLTLGTAIVAIVVTAGIARADVGSAKGAGDNIFVTALVVGLLFMGLLSLFYPPRRRRRL